MYKYSTKMTWLQHWIFVYTIRNSAYVKFILIMFHDLFLACILQIVTQHCNLISNGRHYIAWPYLVGMSFCNLYCVLCIYKNNIVKQNILCTDYMIGLPRPWQWVTSQEKPCKIIQEVLFVIIYIFIHKHSIYIIGTTITFKSWWNNIIYNIYKLIVLKKGYTS
jgi:hypothetical protein